jgi:hypothetical protein
MMSAATGRNNTEYASEPRAKSSSQTPLSETDQVICRRCRSSFAPGRSRFLFGEYAFVLFVEWIGLMKYYPLAFLALTSLKLIPWMSMARALMWFSILMCFVSSFRVWARERRQNEPGSLIKDPAPEA